MIEAKLSEGCFVDLQAVGSRLARSNAWQQQTLVGHDHEGMGGLPDLAQRIEARAVERSATSMASWYHSVLTV